MSKNIFLFLFTILFSSSAIAQKVSYPQLVNRAEAPKIFVNDMILPGEDGKSTLAFTFRFNYDFLHFKKISPNERQDLIPPEDADFYSTIRLISEVFKGSKKEKLSTAIAASRDVWVDTLFTRDFEESKSTEKYTSGTMSTLLEPGKYNYVLQLSVMQETRERNTKRQNIRVYDLAKRKAGEVFLIKAAENTANNLKTPLTLMNMEDNVIYGKDFRALIRIPQFDPEETYTLYVNEVKPTRKDTNIGKEVYNYELQADDIIRDATVELKNTNEPALTIKTGDYPFTYVLLTVPNHQFRNAAYNIRLMKDSDKDWPIAQTYFQSYWINMPASLYNLDIAIDHLKFILNENQLKKFKEGDQKEKRKKFYDFWNSKDPTPNTVYNELMAEYYRRIEYAFKEFGSQESPMGHESDQGKVYINFGPPDSKERLFPTDDKVREIWFYGDKKFVFETSSGFGDFVLINSK